MFVIHDDTSILCVSETRPEPPFVEVIEDNMEEVFSSYEVKNGVLTKKKDMKDFKNFRIAMVASYGINCGLATYTKYLCDEMYPLVKDLKIFSEYGPDDGITRCWCRAGNNYDDLLNEIKNYNPDIVFVQHEYGCFNNGAQWNVLIGHLNSLFRTIVILHSVYEHTDKLIFEAPCQEVIVHSETAKNLLISRGVNHCKIRHIPHGCYIDINIYNFKFSSLKSKHVLFQFGFGFEYHGWDQVIDIVEALSSKYEDLVYIGVFNVSEFSKEFNETYYKNLMDKVQKKKLEKHFVLHKGYRSEEILMSYMKQVSVNIFPYWNHHEWRVHGASGAIRLALASGTPTIVGEVPFFNEFKECLPCCATIEDYVEEITKLFEDNSYRDKIIANTKGYIESRTWDKVALRYLECL